MQSCELLVNYQFHRLVLLLSVQRSSDSSAGGGGQGRGRRPSPRQSIYREAVGRGAEVCTDKTAYVNRVLRRVRLNSPAAQRLALHDAASTTVCRIT